MRDMEQIAVDTLRCALSHEPNVRLIGNVTAREVARLAAAQVMTCPSCGAEAWVNIDCDVCLACSAIGEDAPARDERCAGWEQPDLRAYTVGDAMGLRRTEDAPARDDAGVQEPCLVCRMTGGRHKMSCYPRNREDVAKYGKAKPCVRCGGRGTVGYEDATGCPRWMPCPRCDGSTP